MALLSVKTYFEQIGKDLKYKQILDPFGDLEVSNTEANQSFHVLVQNTRADRRQNEAYDLISSVDVTLYQNCGKDTNAGMNKLISRCEDFIIASMNFFSENGVIVVTLERIDYEPLSERKNDNIILGRLTFSVKHILCLDD